MKIFQKTIYGLILLACMAAISSCEKGFDEINTPYKDASTATASIPGLFNGISKTMVNEDRTLAVSLFYPITNQQGVQNTFAPYLSYTSSLWNNYYPTLYNYKALLKLIAAQSDPALYNNVKFMAMIMMGARTLHMLDYYGDIPYSNASSAEQGPEFYRPAYDKEADIYKSVLADLKAAADGLIASGTQTDIGTSESFLGSDIVAWKKFANALRLRYAVRLFGKEQALATGIITDVIGSNKPLPDATDFASYQTMKKTNFGIWPSTFPATQEKDYFDYFWYAFRELSVSNMRMSSNVWNQVSSNNNTSGSGIFDPRTFVFFQTNDADQWVPQPQVGASDGGTPYLNNNGEFQQRRPIGSDPTNKYAAFNFFLVFDYRNLPYVIISEADVHFLKAEIYQRGIGVAKNIVSAKAEYEEGIRSSINFWYKYAQLSNSWSSKPTAPTTAQINAMLVNPKVLYNGTDDADALKKIITQSWLADMMQPEEAWATARRTGLTPKDPAYNPPVANKLPYPNDERVNNAANWQAATGGAEPQAQMQKKVYWMP